MRSDRYKDNDRKTTVTSVNESVSQAEPYEWDGLLPEEMPEYEGDVDPTIEPLNLYDEDSAVDDVLEAFDASESAEAGVSSDKLSKPLEPEDEYDVEEDYDTYDQYKSIRHTKPSAEGAEAEAKNLAVSAAALSALEQELLLHEAKAAETAILAKRTAEPVVTGIEATDTGNTMQTEPGASDGPKPPKKMSRKEKKAAKKEAKRRAREAETTGQKVRRHIVNLIMWILVGIILVSGYHIGTTLYNYYEARNAYQKVSKEADVDPDQFTGVINFDKLAKKNSDVQGWLYQEDSIINYPVVQGTDNDKYLHTRFDGEWSGGGTLFVDYRCPGDFKGFNSIIYGHHMRDGSMFRCLRGYTKEDGYYDGHKTFELITPSEKYHLVVFSAYITAATSDAYTYEFPDEEAKQDFIDTAFERSKIGLTQDDVEVTTDDNIVTLSTCAYDYDTARYVVICKIVPWTDEEIEAGEQAQKAIDKQKKK